MTLPEGARVLFVRLSALGDVVLELPAFAALRAARPDLHLGWVVEDRAAGILENLPGLDERIVMPRRTWRRLRREAGRGAALAAMRSFARELRAGAWDAALDFQGNLKSGLVTRASGARRRLGFARGATREPNWLFTRERATPAPEAHRRERDHALLHRLAPDETFDLDARVDLDLGDAERAAAATWLGALPPGEGPVMVVHPGTAEFFPQKRWPAARHAALIDRLATERGVRTVLSHGPGERDQVEAIAERMRGPVAIPDRVPTLRELAALLERADLVLGSDTGPLHLASVLGRPTVILFGPYDPRPLHPWGHPERGRYAAIPCSPCRDRDCPRALCMEEISEDEVAATLAAILDDGSPPPGPREPRRTVRR